MNIEIPENARIIIIEGIPGSGKSTFKELLLKHLKDRKLYEYTEQELMLGWKHIHVPHVSSLRLDFANLYIDLFEKILAEDDDAIIVLERFHLSIKVLEWEFENNFNERYEAIIERLRKLPIITLIAKLDLPDIKKRMHHRERSSQWMEFIEEKLVLRGYEDLETLSIEQQKSYFKEAEAQGIPYKEIFVKLNHTPA